MSNVEQSTNQTPVEDLEWNIDQLKTAAKLPAKSRNSQIQPLIHSITSFAYNHGLGTAPLSVLLEIVRSPSHLDQTSITTVLKGLYPAGQVSSSLVYNIIASLGVGGSKPSPATQSLLLRWIILVYEVLEERTILTKLYSTLFNLLDVMSIRPNLCHLLVMITKRCHVKPFRIQMLLEICRMASNDPFLLGLLRVYKDYCPDIIIGQTTFGKLSEFEHPDAEWRDRLRTIQAANQFPAEVSQLQGFAFKVVRRGMKRSRVGVIPEVHTYRVDASSASLEEISGVQDFVDRIERIELPNQMVSALDDPLLQKYIFLRNDTTCRRRIDSWLSLFLDAQLAGEADGEQSSQADSDVLEKILNYTKYMKALPDSVITFFPRYLESWNGRTNRQIILELLSHIPVQPFSGEQALAGYGFILIEADLREKIFKKVENAIVDNTEESYIALLSCYTALLRNWTSHVLLLETRQAPDPLAPLIEHVSLLLLTMLVSYPTIVSQTAVLEHLSTLAHTISHAPTYNAMRILTPKSRTIYLLTFLSPVICTISPLTSLLATYKITFEAAVRRLPPGSNPEYPRPYVNEFNGFLMDVCNLLWRSRAFNTTDINALGCLLPPSIYHHLRAYAEGLSPPQSLHTLFSLSYNPAMAALSIGVFRDMEDEVIGAGDDVPPVRVRHAGPVSQRSLAALAQDRGIRAGWAEYRLNVLKWLSDRGAVGIRELMFCTMTLLMSGKVPVPGQGENLASIV